MYGTLLGFSSFLTCGFSKKKAAESEFVPIVHLYKMSSMESGSLTQKDGTIFSLTARDLQNHKITLFSSSGRGPVGFLWTQRYSYGVAWNSESLTVGIHF